MSLGWIWSSTTPPEETDEWVPPPPIARLPAGQDAVAVLAVLSTALLLEISCRPLTPGGPCGPLLSLRSLKARLFLKLVDLGLEAPHPFL